MLNERWHDAVNGDFVNQCDNPIKSVPYSVMTWQEMSSCQKFAARFIFLAMIFLTISTLLL